MSRCGRFFHVASLTWSAALLLLVALAHALPAGAQAAPNLIGAFSRKVHGAAGTFDLPLSLTQTNPTTEPRQGPGQTVVFVFDKSVTGGVAAVTEGTAVAGAPAFNGTEMIVPLTGVANLQYVTVAVSNVAASDGGSGGSGAVRIGYLAGDISGNRVVTVSDLGQVNAQIAQRVNSGNFTKDINASGTLSVADKGITNSQVTKGLGAVPTPVAQPTIELRLNEVLFKPALNQASFVELKNVGTAPVALGNFSLTNKRGDTYRMPAGVHLLPNGIVLVLFDGQNRMENLVIHTEVSSFLDSEDDALTLYDANGEAVDFISWGEQPFSATSGHSGPLFALDTGASIGRSPGSKAVASSEWAIFATTEVTAGTPNPKPRVQALLPLSGALFAPGAVQLDWYPSVGAVRYRLQVAVDNAFAVALVDATIDDPSFTTPLLSNGTYLWRVQAIAEDGTAADYSEANLLVISDVSASTRGNRAHAAELAPLLVFPFQRTVSQHKDTALLLMESPNEFPPHAWNADHHVTDMKDPADWTCAAAAIAMVNGFYDGQLSQDRINFEVLKDRIAGPELDLVYSREGLSENQFRRAIKFALGGDANPLPLSLKTAPAGTTPAVLLEALWINVQSEINAQRPLIVTQHESSSAHTMVINGYGEFPEGRFVSLLDPLNQGHASAKQYYALIDPLKELWQRGSSLILWNLPANVTAASDEPEIWKDSDGDGVMDFDEIYRFHTSESKQDTDEDRVGDYEDIRASVFDKKFGYAFNPILGIAYRDIDRDGLPMELDPDSDGDGCFKDGDEDTNLNGVYEPELGETHNFVKKDAGCSMTGSVTSTYSFVVRPLGFTTHSITGTISASNLRFLLDRRQSVTGAERVFVLVSGSVSWQESGTLFFPPELGGTGDSCHGHGSGSYQVGGVEDVVVVDESTNPHSIEASISDPRPNFVSYQCTDGTTITSPYLAATWFTTNGPRSVATPQPPQFPRIYDGSVTISQGDGVTAPDVLRTYTWHLTREE